MSRFLVLSCILLSCTLVYARTCKNTPDSPGWPSTLAWNLLNHTVEGRLLALKPVAAVCYPSSSSYNPIACAGVTANYTNTPWRESQPSAVLAINNEFVKNETCPVQPASNASICYQGGVPVYAVNATTVEHVQGAIVFANLFRLRIVVKSSGHDFLGRSTAPGSLLIWTFYMTSKSVSLNFAPTGCRSPSYRGPAVTLQPGVFWKDAYPYVNSFGYDVVGGAGPTVSAAGGFVTGGGHSPLSPVYGLATDNVLQYEVVTALGEHKIINECSDEDLFWALRGGGGGAFAVVISATHKLHPGLPVTVGQYLLFISDQTTWVNAVAKLAEMQPAWNDLGWGGYYYPSPTQITMAFWATNFTTARFQETLAPFQNYLASLPGAYFVGAPPVYYSNFSTAFRQVIQPKGDAMTNYGYYGSRLIPRSVHLRNSQELAQALLSARVISINAIGGGAVHTKGPDSVAANPAWRKTIWHVIASVVWTATTAYEQQLVLRANLTARIGYLRDVTPGSGCYLNEMDHDEPNWQVASFGDHYARLRLVKLVYDPLNLFLCHHCVGSEGWDLEDTNCKIE